MKFFQIKKINKNNLEPIEQFFALSLSCRPDLFANEILNLYKLIGDENAWLFSKNEKSQSIISQTLQKILHKEKINKRWIDASNDIGETIGFYMNELDKLSLKLYENGIEVLALKNTGIARGIFNDYSASPMGDIDILVKPEDFLRAHENFLELGYIFSDRSPFKIKTIKEAFDHGGSEYKCILPNKKILWIELQFRSVAGRWIQPHQEPSAEYLFANSIPINSSFCRLLSPEDNLLQVCLHTAKHSYVRSPGFRLHTDVDRIVTRYNINWDKFAKKVESLSVRTPVYLSLLIPKMLLRSNIPNSVLERLNISPLKHIFLQSWLLNVGLFGPEEKKWNRIGYIIFNLCLFDSFSELLNAVFPNPKNLRNIGEENQILFVFYIKRIFRLLFKRSKNI